MRRGRHWERHCRPATAYELSQRGRSVLVIDRGPIAGGMTARTSAHLAPLCDDLMSEMQKIKGEDQSKLFYESQAAAVDRIEEIQKNEGIDCDFRRLDGYLFQGDGMPSDIIDEELDAVRAVGAPVERLVGVPLSGCDSRHVLRYPRQATFHPLKYLAGVAEASAKRKVRFFADSPVEEVVEENGAVTVKTAHGTIRAGHAVVATNSSIVDRVAVHSKCRLIGRMSLVLPSIAERCRTRSIGTPKSHITMCACSPAITAGISFWSAARIIRAAKPMTRTERFDRLEQWARGKMPMLKDVTHRWSGQVLDTIDYAGFIGKNPGSEYIYVATGDSGQGLTHGVMGAMLNATLVTGGESKWAELYAPDRKPLKAAKNWVMENNTALKNLAEYVAPGEISSPDELEPGQGAIIRQGLKEDRCLSRCQRDCSPAFRRLHAPRLPSALE